MNAGLDGHRRAKDRRVLKPLPGFAVLIVEERTAFLEGEFSAEAFGSSSDEVSLVEGVHVHNAVVTLDE